MRRRTCLAIVLAAGEGTRMRASLPKVLHAIGGRTLLAHVLTAATQAGGGDIAVVVGPDHDAVADEAQAFAPEAQDVRADASGAAPRMRCWRPQGASHAGADDILVIFGDTPLMRPETLAKLRAALGERRGGGGARFPAGRSDRLRPAGHAGRRAARDPRGRATPARRSARSACAMAG